MIEKLFTPIHLKDFKITPTEKKLRLVLALFITILAMVTVLSYYSITKLINTGVWVAHTHEVIAVAECVLSDLQDVEVGSRGYALVQDKKYLHPYYSGKEKYPTDLEALKTLTSDNKSQQNRIIELKKLCDLKINRSKVLIDVCMKNGPGNAAKAMEDLYDKVIMDQIRSVMGIIIDEENSLLQDRLNMWNKTESIALHSRILLPILIFVDFILVCGVYYYVTWLAEKLEQKGEKDC